MARIGVRKGNIRRLSISVSEATADWIETQVESQRYRNISHTIESLIREKMVAESSK
jgi:Arc/MetJ-type ribon-helix-helix transcriptional regulator